MPRAAAREREPLLTKPITAELGGVSPIIVVPGQWTDADLRYQAEHISTMRLYNSGHNCLAGQVVLVSADWPQRDAFVRALRSAFADAPARPVWYPRSDERRDAAAASFPDATLSGDGSRLLIEVPPGEDATALETIEYFTPVLGVVTLSGNGQEFLDAAVAHANERLTGTLGANVLIDPDTRDALGEGFERAIADLRYGAVSINSWTALAFLTPTLTWGGYPGSTLEDVESGIGIVHNALLLDHVERTVTRGPFRPFPRSLGVGLRSRSLSAAIALPKPPWFVHARTGAVVSEGFTRFRMDGDLASPRGDDRPRTAGMSRPRRTHPDLTADYVVVGAGSAGAALAARLSEDPAVSVLLLEAGPPDTALELHVPAAFSKLFRGVYDWNYDTVPQPELEGPHDLLAAREDARRLVVAQRDDVDPRVRRGLRRLGGRGRRAVVMGRPGARTSGASSARRVRATRPTARTDSTRSSISAIRAGRRRPSSPPPRRPATP